MAKVIVVDYDPSWAATFERLRAGIWPCIRDVATAIEHVGSTSVRGLAAKPIIDMTIVVPTGAAMQTVIDRLPVIGYRHRGDLGVPGREAFARPPGTPDHHLYACVVGNDGLRNHLAVRDYLRRDAVAAQAYGNLKKQLSTGFADDIDGYVDGKTEFILAILAGADLSPEQIDTIRAINSKPQEAG
ncbi:MAG TPA: GrpB family protein [Longimicrobiaceae bacterium]|nr:GrpB family protein [Longimicrobiaceae bacterium]